MSYQFNIAMGRYNATNEIWAGYRLQGGTNITNRIAIANDTSIL